MFLLMRWISPYTAPHILLGVFVTRDEAEVAKAHYARVREANPEADPWKKQAHKRQFVVSQDLEIEQLPGDFETGTVVFVVSDHSDGMGQEIRQLDSIVAEASMAMARVTELDMADGEEDSFPHYAVIDTVVVGSLHSDLEEDQPLPRWRQGPNRPLSLSYRARRLFRDV